MSTDSKLRKPAPRRPVVPWTTALAAAALFPSCLTPGDHRAKADASAAGLIDATQQLALGRQEPFTIERPSETLRRRLLIDQELPRSSDASLDRQDLLKIDHWPEDSGPAGTSVSPTDLVAFPDRGPVVLTLVNALRVGAANSRDFQDQKEAVFRAALSLDLSCNEFHSQLQGLIEGGIQSTLDRDPVTGDRTRTTGIDGTTSVGLDRQFQNGTSISTQIGVDVARLLTTPYNRSLAVFSDTSITIPLLRGAGRHIVAEPLIQAERDLLYEILRFERFKRTFVVDVASAYLSVLQQENQVENAEQNYKSLIKTTRQLRRNFEAGRTPGFEVDQAQQDVLRARDSWVGSIQSHRQQLDNFRIQLGLPTDAEIDLERGELDRLGATVREVLAPFLALSEQKVRDAEAASSPGPTPTDVTTDAVAAHDAVIALPPPGDGPAGPWELEGRRAVEVALQRRLDLMVSQGDVYDSQRALVIAADALRGEVTLFGSASLGEHRSVGSATAPNSETLRTSEASYDAMLTVDLPLQRVAERIQYRNAWIALDQSVRSLQALEDRVKLDVRSRLRDLLEAREGLRIQDTAVGLAESRVKNTRLLLDAGRAQTRDLLEAQEDLVSAQNSLTAALIAYRIAELELQRDMGILEVNEQGIWTEASPEEVIARAAAIPARTHVTHSAGGVPTKATETLREGARP